MSIEGLTAEEIAQQYAMELSIEKERVQYLTTYFGELIEAMVAGVIIADEDLFVTSCNSAAEKIIGIPQSTIEGMPLSQLLPDEFKAFAHLDTGLESLQRFQQELLLVRGNDEANVPLLISASPIILHSGAIEGVVCVAQDLSAQKELEDELLQARKLESVGQLAAGVAHEINTPIQYVRDNMLFLENEFKGIADFLKRTHTALQNPSNLETYIKEIETISKELDIDYLIDEIPAAIAQTLEGAESVAKIVNSMKVFSHPGSENKQIMDINDALESTLTVSRNEWKYHSEVITDLCTPAPQALCYGSELNQAFLNLIINASQAIRERIDNKEITGGTIHVSTTVDNSTLSIQISDNGSGIPKKIQERIFDPFFTTKDVGKGTGQGLTMVRSCIIDRHNGSIEVHSDVGKGTTFTIQLPLE